MNFIENIKISFKKDRSVYWSNLESTTNMLILLNFILFFVSRLVITDGYYYTYISIFCLATVKTGLLLPLGQLDNVLYYMISLLFEFIAIYFLAVSIWYWITTNIS
jgi:hypothetical protein